MTAKQWAARAVLAAAMAAGLSACGGGGDGAAPAPAASTPEILTPGLTIKASSDSAFTVNSRYSDILGIGIRDIDNTSATEATVYAQNDNNIGLMATYSKSSGTVSRVVFLKSPPQKTWNAVGCGFSGFSCDINRISVNPNTKEVRITDLPLKTLAFTTPSGAEIIFDSGTQLSTSPGSVVISGVLTLP